MTDEINIIIDSGSQADMFGEPVPVEVKRTCILVKPTLEDYALASGVNLYSTAPAITENDILKGGIQ